MVETSEEQPKLDQLTVNTDPDDSVVLEEDSYSPRIIW